MLSWIYKPFEELTPYEVYDLLDLRQRVFIVEQNCVFQDTDGVDQRAHHLLLYTHTELTDSIPQRDGIRKRLVAYARITPPGTFLDELSVGRIVSDPAERNKGYGKLVTEKAIEKAKELYGNVPIRIAAQSYLRNFYSTFGFKPIEEEYEWDGIMHQDMILG